MRLSFQVKNISDRLTSEAVVYVSYIMPSSHTDFFIPCKLRDQVLSSHLMISNFDLQAKKARLYLPETIWKTDTSTISPFSVILLFRFLQ